MIQDIWPHVYHNEFVQAEMKDTDTVFLFKDRGVFLRIYGDQIAYPQVGELSEELKSQLKFLFRIDETAYYLLMEADAEQIPEGCSFENISLLRNVGPKHLSFAGLTAHSLYEWYESRKFCGHCGQKMQHSDQERMMFCPHCGLMEYPKICPAVIIGITNGDRLLVSKYAGGQYRRYALVAGFAEIGETLEDTVRREVMEEVGLKVKNIRYYKSQPWGMSNSLLAGFFCELDGSDEIHLDRTELACAEWMARPDVPTEEADFSLTREMMRTFHEGREPR